MKREVIYKTITTVYFLDCPAEVDEVWNIEWPFATAGSTVTVSCGVNFVGNIYMYYVA